MKLLITGTAGFIGYHLARKMLSLGVEVIGLDNINDYYDQDLKYSRLHDCGINSKQIQARELLQSELFPGYRFIQLDLSNREAINQLFRKEQFDAVCNLAAQAGVRYSLTHPHAYIESNITGFLNILEACRNFPVSHLVYASSSSVYGLNTALPFSTSQHTDHPVSMYAASKKSNEMMAHAYSSLYGLPVTGLRFFTVYGPWGRPDMALFIFTKSILEGKPIDIYNNGLLERDFTYVADIVEGISRIIPRPPTNNKSWNSEHPDPSYSSAPYRLYNIGNNQAVKLTDFIDAIEANLGMKAIRNYMPMQPGDVVKTWADVEDLIKDFNYAPKTPVKEGIRKFIKWYREYYR
jgi:UDP-glucuronate 4-epimerase